MTRALICLDGSDLALDAPRQALRLLDPDRLEVTLVRVVPAAMTSALVAGAPGAAIAIDPTLAEETTDSLERDAADDLAGTQRALDVSGSRRTLTGDPGPGICALAGDGGFDVVVVGSHGSGLLKPGAARLGQSSRPEPPAVPRPRRPSRRERTIVTTPARRSRTTARTRMNRAFSESSESRSATADPAELRLTYHRHGSSIVVEVHGEVDRDYERASPD